MRSSAYLSFKGRGIFQTYLTVLYFGTMSQSGDRWRKYLDRSVSSLPSLLLDERYTALEAALSKNLYVANGEQDSHLSTREVEIPMCHGSATA